MSVLIVTGTSTDVGKTIATAALAAAARADGRTVAVCKPAQTGLAAGEPGDLADVLRLAGDVTVLELARYPEPLAPDTAARRAGMPLLTLSEVLAAVRELDGAHDLTLVEGAGGVLVRLGEGGFTIADVARELGAPVVVVVDPALGALNHTALTTQALAHAGAECAGLIIGSWPAEPDLAMRCNLEDLTASAKILGRIPAGAGRLAPAQFQEFAVAMRQDVPDVEPRLPNS